MIKTISTSTTNIGIRSNFDDWIKHEFEKQVSLPVPPINIPTIRKVIFNDPATIILWADGTKTVVKKQPGETFDPEKGMAMAVTKKAFGNKGRYYEQFKKWIKEFEESDGE